MLGFRPSLEMQLNGREQAPYNCIYIIYSHYFFHGKSLFACSKSTKCHVIVGTSCEPVREGETLRHSRRKQTVGTWSQNWCAYLKEMAWCCWSRCSYSTLHVLHFIKCRTDPFNIELVWEALIISLHTVHSTSIQFHICTVQLCNHIKLSEMIRKSTCIVDYGPIVFSSSYSLVITFIIVHISP